MISYFLQDRYLKVESLLFHFSFLISETQKKEARKGGSFRDKKEALLFEGKIL